MCCDIRFNEALSSNSKEVCPPRTLEQATDTRLTGAAPQQEYGDQHNSQDVRMYFNMIATVAEKETSEP